MFDFCGHMKYGYLPCEPLKVRKEIPIERIRYFSAHDMGMQISCDIYPEIQEKGIVWRPEKISWRSISRIGKSKRMRNRRGSFMCGSCAHIDVNSAKIFSFNDSRLFEREECDLRCKEFHGTQKKYDRAKLMGARLFCHNSRKRRRDNSKLCPESRT